MSDQVHLLLVGTSHRHAPIAVREQLASHAHGERLIESVIAEEAVIEAVGLSTCNRCELYMVGADPEAMRAAALRRLAEYAHRSEQEVEPLLYVREGADAAEHLFEVAGGLDSLVPGEAQILAQIRQSYQHALEMGSTGTVSNRLFHEALEAGKRVRHETAIGRSNASVASVAAELVREKLGTDLHGAQVLIVGAGKVAELVAQNLASRTGVRIVVANRSRQRAAALAERFDGGVVGLDQLAEAVAAADVVVSSTLSDEHLIRPGDVPPGRRVLVDLALPRDIDPAVARLRASPWSTWTTWRRRCCATSGCDRSRRRRHTRSWPSRRPSSAAGWRRLRWCRRSPSCGRWPSRSAPMSSTAWRAAGTASPKPTGNGSTS
jgi:glutamyl-tRNA reductase